MPQLKEQWPLAFFSVLAPAGAGAGAALSSFFPLFTPYVLDPVFTPVALCMGASFAVALAIFTLKTRRKLRMLRAILPSFRSALSSAIFLLFAGLLLYLAAAALHHLTPAYRIHALSLFWLASAAGLASIFGLRGAYKLRSTPRWTGTRVLAMLTSSALLLGSLQAMLILNFCAGKMPGDTALHLQYFFFAALFCDVLHLNELRSLGRKALSAIVGITRVPIYLCVFHLLGRIDIVMFSIVLAIGFAGDLLVRLVFYSERTRSVETELSRARLLRLTRRESK